MEDIKIEKLDNFGRGICYFNNKITFIKNALPDEIISYKIIKENKKYNLAEVTEYKKYSEKRTKPFCPYYLKCGGCNLEHLDYKSTLEFKLNKVKQILDKEKIIYDNIEIVSNEVPKNYRNKLSLKVKDYLIGFYEEGTHNIIEVKNCSIAYNSINEVLKRIKYLNIKNGNVTIRSNYNDEILLIIDTNDKIKFNIALFSNLKIVGVIVNKKVIYGQNFFYESINGYLFKVSFDAFFQVNQFITSKLFNIIEENIDESNTILDLYSGVGTLGIVASKKAKKVYSIEIVKNAVLDNITNKKLNKKDNIYPILGDAKKVITKIKDKFDTILIDPPRKGLDSLSKNLILNNDVSKIIYISCDLMTLVRDLKELTKKYKIIKYYVLDMFSYTYHVECVCVMTRR